MNDGVDESSGSLVELFNLDPWLAGSSLTRDNVLCPWARLFILCLIELVQHKKRTDMTEELRVIIWERQNQLEIEKIDFLEILPNFNFYREMNKNAYYF